MGQGIFTRTISKEEINDLITSKGYQNESQVKALLDALVAAAPSTLDTLAEIAEALGNDPNFASTMTTLLAEKASTVYVDEQLSTKAEVKHTHLANEVTFTDGDTFQQKYDDGSLTGPAGPQGEAGQPFEITTSYPTLEELQELFPTGTEGFFLIGTPQDNEIYYWDSVNSRWSSAGSLQGIEGPQGDPGATPNLNITATIDNFVGVPSVDITKSGDLKNPSFLLSFHNLKGADGEKGEKGEQGLTPVFTIENGHLFVEYLDSSEINNIASIANKVMNDGVFKIQ